MNQEAYTHLSKAAKPNQVLISNSTRNMVLGHSGALIFATHYTLPDGIPMHDRRAASRSL